MRLIYRGLCPNCEGDISDSRLLKGSLCSKCLKKPTSSFKIIWKELKKSRRLKKYYQVLKLNYEFNEVKKLFKKILRSKPSSLQEIWIKRALLGESFSILAPTGIGKSVTGLILSIYFSGIKKKKSYLMFPTTLLVQQAENKLKEFLKKSGIHASIVSYHSALSKKQKEEAKEKIISNDFSILITTDRFLSKNFELIKTKFNFVFVDDADSFLKSTKNIDKIVKILGGDDKLLEIAEKKVKGGKIDEDEEIYEETAKSKLGILVFSSATAIQKRTKKIRIFREIFGFDVGFKTEFLRNIEDFYVEDKKVKERVLELVKKLGKGGLIFIPMALGKDFLNEIKNYLTDNGIKAETYEKPKEELIEKFRKGEVEVLLGISSFRSPLSRGLDLPETIRYALFAGVPRMEIPLTLETYNPTRLLTISNIIIDLVGEKERDEILAIANKLKKIVPLSKDSIEKIEKGENLDEFHSYARSLILKSREILSKIITPELLEKIDKSREIRLKKDEEGFKLIVADPRGYLQASGRTSRMYVGGLSKGLCILIVDDEKAFFGLERRIKFYIDDFEFKEYNETEVKKVLYEVDKDRKRIRDILNGKYIEELKDLIKVYLLIVESPTKAKTIARFFGRPNRRRIGNLTVYEISVGNKILEIVASAGHITDLVENVGFDGIYVMSDGKDFLPVYATIKKCRKCGEQFVGYKRCPFCGSKEFFDKKETIETLRKLALETNGIILATDADAEGEKISYDLMLLLKPYNQKIGRMEFHEVTRRAILRGLENLREVNLGLVNAQILRRIEDRWIGFELSKILKRKFRESNLSAGRVQTPVLGWIIKRTKEVFEKVPVAKVILENGEIFTVKEISEDIKKVKEVKIEVDEKKVDVKPFPPFTTDTMLKESSKKLKFSAEKTMKLAQDLFENGLITYHRTDSTHVSSVGISIAKEYMENENVLDLFEPKSYGKEGTHECIRPTRPLDKNQLMNLIKTKILIVQSNLTKDHFALYDLIFKRFIASQSKPAKLLKQKIKVKIGPYCVEEERNVELKFEGFYRFVEFKPDKRIAPGIYKVKSIKIFRISKSRPYTQGELVSLMKERGIGRPSTYAKIISTILKRNYAVERKNFLFATKKGMKIFDFLNKNYNEYVSEEFTKKLEDDMDSVAKGEKNHLKIIKELYNKVSKLNVYKSVLTK